MKISEMNERIALLKAVREIAQPLNALHIYTDFRKVVETKSISQTLKAMAVALRELDNIPTTKVPSKIYYKEVFFDDGQRQDWGMFDLQGQLIAGYHGYNGVAWETLEVVPYILQPVPNGTARVCNIDGTTGYVYK